MDAAFYSYVEEVHHRKAGDSEINMLTDDAREAAQ